MAQAAAYVALVLSSLACLCSLFAAFMYELDREQQHLDRTLGYGRTFYWPAYFLIAVLSIAWILWLG